MYEPKAIEAKWREFWEVNGLHKMPSEYSGKKFYVLGAWAYPSGDAHMGHVRNYTITDVVARFKRRMGYNVLNPVGWDAFGLPTENAAIIRKTDPFTWNRKCIQKMEDQFKSLGFSYDWDLAIDTSHPEYYKWTQWLLIKLWERKLLYKALRAVNWCTSCQTVLANEQVIDGRCARCSSEVIKKEMDQWFIKITDYAERLLEDFSELEEWPRNVLKMQEHWIGREKDGRLKIQDWCISRQRYWGAPIPFVTCNCCGIQPVPKDQLPVLLPRGLDFSPGWPPPLARDSSFREALCPKCGGPAERASEVMDTFVFSAYYFLRFTDPRNKKEIFSESAESFWMPVDLYVSGVELVNNHLIYARFFHKALYDMGLVKEPEPFKRFYAQGMVLLNGEKMSKSKGNVVSPVEIMEKYGADTLRTFVLFVGPPEADVEWSDQGVNGSHHFLQRLYALVSKFSKSYEKGWAEYLDGHDIETGDQHIRHKTNSVLAKVTDIYNRTLKFNVAVAFLMELLNELEKYAEGNSNHWVMSEAVELIVHMISPIAPHLAEELWEMLGKDASVFQQSWPKNSESVSAPSEVIVVIQVNGKKRGTVSMSQEMASDREAAIAKALEFVGDDIREFKNTIFVPRKIVNFVT
jgi:leucyl-tRNA synthetase